MPGAIELTIKYSNGTEEHFSSISKCAQKYKMSLPLMQLRIAGYYLPDSPFPEDTVFIMKKKNSDNMGGKWHCEICNKSMTYSSKSNHLKSQKHAKLGKKTE